MAVVARSWVLVTRSTTWLLRESAPDFHGPSLARIEIVHQRKSLRGFQPCGMKGAWHSKRRLWGGRGHLVLIFLFG